MDATGPGYGQRRSTDHVYGRPASVTSKPSRPEASEGSQERGATRPDTVERMTFGLGPCLFLILVVVGAVITLTEWHANTMGAYLQAVAGGAGLLTIGHSIHRTARIGRARLDEGHRGAGPRKSGDPS
jgi:hypothetical protein